MKDPCSKPAAQGSHPVFIWRCTQPLRYSTKKKREREKIFSCLICYHLKIKLFNNFKKLFFKSNFVIYSQLCWVLIAACGLSSGCGEKGLLSSLVRGFIIMVASLVAEHRL